MQYLVETRDNVLYGGGYRANGRYLSYGQQTFIFDLVVTAARRGVHVELITDLPNRFPILGLLRGKGVCLAALDRSRRDGSPLFIDEMTFSTLPESWTEAVASAVRILHNPNRPGCGRILERVKNVAVMTENALATLQRALPQANARVVHQGVDLLRLSPMTGGRSVARGRRVLIVSRLSDEKVAILTAVTNDLLVGGWRVSIVGNGPAERRIRAALGNGAQFLGYANYATLPDLMKCSSLVISSGRGVMEALAVGVPSICAGWGYGGVVDPQSVVQLVQRNLTGYGMPYRTGTIVKDAERALSMPGEACRAIAEDHFDMRATLSALFEMSAA